MEPDRAAGRHAWLTATRCSACTRQTPETTRRNEAVTYAEWQAGRSALAAQRRAACVRRATASITASFALAGCRRALLFDLTLGARGDRRCAQGCRSAAVHRSSTHEADGPMLALCPRADEGWPGTSRTQAFRPAASSRLADAADDQTTIAARRAVPAVAKNAMGV